MRPSLRALEGALRARPPAQAVLLETPATATPRDVLRALAEAGVEGIAPSQVTSYPVGATRPALTTTYHIQAGRRAPALAAALASRPLFYGGGRAATPAGGRPALGVTPGLREPPAATTTPYDARAWAAHNLERAASTQGAKARDPIPPIPVEWAIDPARSGRRVLVRGLPSRVPPIQVASLLAEFGEAGVEDAPRQVPPARWSLGSSWVLTANSVADAHALARKLNMNYYREVAYGKRFLMRASVVW
ncbi:hypothetical protein Q8F55_006953 [Vanrija albida]|uniref:RRM domain-containing protein n=1 Tax=Vanrija albida TaxID=181172 RepID=A0ABR3PYH0_9TREE